VGCGPPRLEPIVLMGTAHRRRSRGGRGLVALDEAVVATEVVVLVAGFGYAAVADWREREVTDRLWQVLGVIGVVLGGLVTAPGGVLPLVLWLVVGGFALEHMFPWSLGPRFERYEDLLDLAIYVSVIAVVAAAIVRVGIGSSAVPYTVVAALASVLFARALFETGLLYGGADAKAIMIAGVLVPLFPVPLLLPASSVLSVTAVLPFSVNLLMDAALLSAGIPIALAFRNLARHDFHGWQGFTGYMIAVSDLPDRFVWVRNPMFGAARAEEDEIETSEQDRLRRQKIARSLSEQGIQRVWVTPQIPYLVLLAAGAVAALLAGNLVVDLISLL